jgi:hypothetical protein
MLVLGKRGELAFAEECLARGLSVLDPVGTRGYDFVVEHNGKYTKVQVKATQRAYAEKDKPSAAYSWTCASKSAESEVYVFHILDTGLFYIVPTERVGKGKTFKIRQESKKFSQYLNNFDIFK